jgi:hypothetical protein
MLRIAFKPYDKVRFGVPWAGVVYAWRSVLPLDGLRPPHGLDVLGKWQGSARDGGHVHLLARMPPIQIGEVLRWGQRNRATGRTVNEGYGIVLSPSTYKVVDRHMAWQWFVTVRRV